jgi:hypothetical protein
MGKSYKETEENILKIERVGWRFRNTIGLVLSEEMQFQHTKNITIRIRVSRFWKLNKILQTLIGKES